MATIKDVERTPSGRLTYRGETFPGYNVQIRYGDPNLSIKKSQPKRRKSFRARHNCDAVEKKKDVFTAGYWSCKNW